MDGNSRLVEREVSEVVGGELHLEPVDAPLLRDRHHSGVVDQHVQLTVPRFCKRANRCEVSEVEPTDLCRPVDRLAGREAALQVAHGEHDVGPDACQLPCGDQPDSAVGTRDDDSPAAQLGQVGSRPPVAHDSRLGGPGAAGLHPRAAHEAGRQPASITIARSRVTEPSNCRSQHADADRAPSPASTSSVGRVVRCTSTALSAGDQLMNTVGSIAVLGEYVDVARYGARRRARTEATCVLTGTDRLQQHGLLRRVTS